MDKIKAIALATFRESVRSKVLYAVLFFAAFLLLVSTFFGTVTIGDQVKVIKDFGLFSISIFSVAFAVISGASLLSKELTKKTIYNILSKSVYRWQFLAGKYLGMLITAFSLVIMMGVALIVYMYFFERRVDFLILDALLYMVLELIVICAAAIFFSSIVVTPLLSGLFTFGLFLAGRSTEYLLYFVRNGDLAGAPASMLKGLNAILPNLDKLYVANEVVYANVEALTAARLFWCTLYAVGYAAMLLTAANIIFTRREFN